MIDTTLWQRLILKGSPRVLQNLICADIHQMTHTPQWSAFCNQSGKVISTCWISTQNDTWSVDIPQSLENILVQHLQKYALREPFIITHSQVESDARFTMNYAIVHRHPILGTNTTERFTPHMLHCDQITDAISWTKGCYLGQEVIMRTHQLGKNKRTLQAFKTPHPIQAQSIQDEQGRVIGSIINQMHQDECTYLSGVVTEATTYFIDDQPLTLL
tara:strand:+ start:4046 stop:4693 length:648 start_codon:yes stop_codon:yes gene_type:complete